MLLSNLSRPLTIGLVLVIGTFSLSCSGDRQSQTATKRAPSGPPLYEGYFDIANCELIHGWVWNQNDPDTALSVEIYDGETLLATVEADEPRGDLVTAGKGNGKYAFTYIPPPVLKDSKPHMIRVKVEGADFELGNSPKTISCPAQ